jgi:hypothetical protein
MVALVASAVIVPVTARAEPLNVRLAESVKRPPVVAYVTRPDVRPEKVIEPDDVMPVKPVRIPASLKMPTEF